MRFYLIIILCLISPVGMAFDLFGVAIDNINRVAFRAAINDSGAVVVREAGDDNWYDIYDLSANFKQSKQLFVAYEKTSGNFAFAEYHLPYRYLAGMLQRMRAKYGKPVLKYGTYESDTEYRWQIDSINIVLLQDWEKNITRLVYSRSDNLQALQQAYQQEQLQKFTAAMGINDTYY